jgi:hypothetical protein
VAGLVHRLQVRAELHRVGASSRKAGAANCITVTEDDEFVSLVGLGKGQPHRYWRGRRWQLLDLLAALPEDAGIPSVWWALSKGSLRSRVW